MKFYKVEVNGEDLYQKYKHDSERFKWVTLPQYFKEDNYIVYFTMYGLNRFVETDYIDLLNNYTKDDFDFIEVMIETKDKNIVFSANKYLVYKIKEDNLGLIT